MTWNINVSRYEFVRDELQLMIIGTHQNAVMSKWRRNYEDRNEWEKIQIADKVGRFFRLFRQGALSFVNTSEPRYGPYGQSPEQLDDWYEQFGWRDYTIEFMLRTIRLSIQELCMYIEFEIECEPIYRSAREDRYLRRQERAREREEEEIENNIVALIGPQDRLEALLAERWI